MTEVLTQLIDALNLEVAAIHRKGGGTQIELRGGERVGQTEGSWLYKFVVVEDLNLRDDTPIRITVGQEDVPGVIVSFRDGVILVALEKDMGIKIAAARLVANDAFLVERLRERIEKIRNGEVQFNRLAAERVFGLCDIQVADMEPHPSVIQDGGANADQILAVRRSLGSDTTFVWGPPGTGKTTTLARIVEAHYRAGRSVLLVSNTNIAVDTALEKVAERLKGETDFHQGLVIRHGPIVKEELRQKFGPQVILEEIVARLSESLIAEKNGLIQQVAPSEAEEILLLTALKDIESLFQARATLTAREKELDAVRSNVTARIRESDRHKAMTAKMRVDIEHARAMGSIRRFLSGVNTEKLEREIVASDRAARASIEASRAIAAKIPELETKVSSLSNQIDEFASNLERYPPEAQIKARRIILHNQMSQIRERIIGIDRELDELGKQVLARCKILATTVYRTYISKTPLRQFDVVVIDEASMLMPPLVYYVAGLATKSVTVAGDFRQLPPIVMSDESLALEWLKRDVFEIAGIPQRLKQGQPTPHLVALGIQYRMHEQICAVINDLFYPDHPLRSDSSVNYSGEYFPLATAPLLYVDTAPFHPWTALRVGSFSRYNLFHALLVRNIVLHLAETGLLPATGEPNGVIGAVSRYASQARLIQALLDDRLGPRAIGIAATVHRFQGNEKQVMVLDLTDSIGTQLGRYLQATHLEEDGARLLNVAASRAKRHVILIGNFEYLRNKAPHGGFVRRLVDHFEKHGEPLDLNKLLPLANGEWVDGLHRILPPIFELPEGATGAFTEGTFYPAFLKDVASAQESVVVFSPFATSRGTGRWIDSLRASLARGIRVRILTRPPEKPGGAETNEVSELIHALRDLGVTVDLRERMHEKIAILDGRILWHGSLNILSHRDTHESMLRIESPAACQQLGRFVSAPIGRHNEAPMLDAKENPVCPMCNGSTVWNNGRYGIWFSCEDPNCKGKVDPRKQGSGHRGTGIARPNAGGNGQAQGGREARTPTGKSCPEPGCNGHLAERKGRYGRFLGCSRYPSCRYTKNLD